jgi:hypothetical protein
MPAYLAGNVLRSGWEEWHARGGHGDTSKGLPFDGLATLQLLEHNPFFSFWDSPPSCVCVLLIWAVAAWRPPAPSGAGTLR